MIYVNKKFKIHVSIFLSLLIILIGCSQNEQDSGLSVAPENFAGHDVVKIIVSQEGMYSLSLTDIGWDKLEIEDLALTQKGQSIPYQIEVSGSEKNIIFYGESSTSPYTPNNVYLLQQNASLTKEMKSDPMAEPVKDVVNYIHKKIHLEENHIYSPKTIGGDPWHWQKIIAPQSSTVEINLPQAIDGPGYLRLTLYGVTSAPTSPDHHIQVHINDQYIAETAWDEQITHLLEAPIPEGVLLDGKNTIEIQATGEIDARIDIVNLDWIEIDYRKRSQNLDPQETFSVSEQAVEFSEIEGPVTFFDVSNSSATIQITPSLDQKYEQFFQGKPGLNYIVVRPDGYFQPDQVLPSQIFPDLRSENGANYIVIGHPDYFPPLEPLLKLRSEQGLSTLTIPTDTIYDQFNNGITEPQAIQNFLRYAVENWSTTPEYILIIGDTSYDFYGYKTEVLISFVPTFMVNTIFGGETSSDVNIAQINDDPWPDIAIGRVPARSPEDVEIFVNKTLNFEESILAVDWTSSILAIADGQEPVFKSDATHFINQFPDTYQTQLIAPDPGAEGTNHQITAEFDKGQFLTAYFGHGSINMWGKDSLFTTEDSSNLQNMDHLPVILNFTCLTGLFTHPTEESLAESLLFNPRGGAVAVLAPTSPTLPTDQSFLSDAFIEALTQESKGRLGDVTLYAWRKVPTTSEGAVDVMQTFLLFGDPALLMPNH